MSFEAQRIYLTAKMKNGWDDHLPCAYPNLPFNIPVNNPYCEFHYKQGEKPVPISGEGEGKVRNRYVGFVQLTVWIPTDAGTAIGTRAGDVFKPIFHFKQGRDTACALYRFGPIAEMQATVKAGWECLIYRVPYEKDIVEDIPTTIMS